MLNVEAPALCGAVYVCARENVNGISYRFSHGLTLTHVLRVDSLL